MAKRSREALDIEDNPQSPNYSAPRLDSNDPITPGLETKLVHLNPAMESKREVMRCSLPGHRPDLSFTTFDEYDLHYKKSHFNRCAACNHNFPTPHLLSLHQAEFHDPIAQVRRSRGEKIYACFVEDCRKVCMTPRKRISHLMDKHGYPKNYEFAVVKTGVDGKRSLLREEKPERTRRRGLTLEKKKQTESTVRAVEEAGTSMDVDQKETKDVAPPLPKTELLIIPPAPEIKAVALSGFTEGCFTSSVLASKITSPTAPDEAMEIDDLVGAMSALRFVPPSVRFGKGKGRPKPSKSG